jgi:hypothetical protein
MNVASRAALLRAQLNAGVARGDTDVVAAARDARRIFEERGDEVRARWLSLELGGYGTAESRPVHDALGVPASDRLVAHVTAYRVQRGNELAPNPNGGPFSHFFVEGLTDLTAARDRVRQVSSPKVEVQLRPDGTSGYPMRAEFPHDVFERVVSGFLASLFLQLGSVK